MKKETQQLREFEEGLVSQYKFYLEDLEQTIKGTKPMTHKHTPYTVKLKLVFYRTSFLTTAAWFVVCCK